ncbi:MAG: NAD(P)/FAD-dependent oxidoreductase [Jatrophihabitans sp.]|uniref:NAD(P)/FAD-dependent oxidoreductase n=1 Tax=Jatrophihabitans sp. TaxID=1932789 RepID=UPI003911CD54
MVGKPRPAPYGDCVSADWDVVVVGAGPAGTAAALAARRADPDSRVLLLDAAVFPRDKVCGDGIAPQAFDVLAGLGVDIDALVAGTEPIDRLRLVSPGGVTAARRFARPARVVPRLVFDARLVQEAVAAGVVLEQGRVRTVDVDPDGAVIDGVIRAGVVIGADGAESVVRRQCGARPPRRGTVAIALRGYVPADDWPAGEQLLAMTRAHWPAYAWAFPVGDGTVNVGYGELIRSTPPSRAQLTHRLHALLPSVAESASLRGHRLPLSPGRPAVGRGRVLLTGDAASLINPLTGEGIYYAVLSGALAGVAAAGDSPAASYRAAMHRALGRHLRHTDRLARLVRRPQLLDVGTAAAARSQSAFDRLTEIGLGAGTVDPQLIGAMVAELLPPRRVIRRGPGNNIGAML